MRAVLPQPIRELRRLGRRKTDARRGRRWRAVLLTEGREGQQEKLCEIDLKRGAHSDRRPTLPRRRPVPGRRRGAFQLLCDTSLVCSHDLRKSVPWAEKRKLHLITSLHPDVPHVAAPPPLVGGRRGV